VIAEPLGRTLITLFVPTLAMGGALAMRALDALGPRRRTRLALRTMLALRSMIALRTVLALRAMLALQTVLALRTVLALQTVLALRSMLPLRPGLARRFLRSCRLAARLVGAARPTATAAAPTALGCLEVHRLETGDLNAGNR
jgi:hypothetical protein